MTPKFSLITLVAGAALVFAVPAAFGEGGRLSGSPETVLAQPDPMIEDGFAQAVAAKRALESNVGTYRDAHERGGVANQNEPQWLKALMARSEGLNKQYGLGEFAPKSNVTEYRDSFERGISAEPQSMTALRIRSEALNKKYGLGEFATNSTVSNYRDAFERAVPPTTAPVPASVTSSGNDIEWPQVGVGLGIGLLLALGLGLIMRAVHTRPFAH